MSGACTVTVVVANACRDPGRVRPAVEALRAEVRPSDDQVVWVDRAGLAPPGAGDAFECLEAPATATRGDLYGLGLAKAAGEVVAFTDSTTTVLSGWRDALVGAYRQGARVMGGPVFPGEPRTRLGWAGFLVEYAAHAVAPFVSATGDVSGNNVAYAREILAVLGGAPVWKAVVNRSLAEEGTTPTLVPDMAVVVHKEYTWRDLVPERFRHGRMYAAGVAGGWGPAPRIARTGLSALLPAVMVARVRAAARPDPALARRFAQTAPIVALACAAWSAGEAVGYLLGPGSTDGLL